MRKTITLPIKRAAKDNDPMVLDTFGVRDVEIVRIRANYRDVVKAVVEGSDKDVAEIASRSREHFEALWPQRTEGQPDDE